MVFCQGVKWRAEWCVVLVVYQFGYLLIAFDLNITMIMLAPTGLVAGAPRVGPASKL